MGATNLPSLTSSRSCCPDLDTTTAANIFANPLSEAWVLAPMLGRTFFQICSTASAAALTTAAGAPGLRSCRRFDVSTKAMTVASVGCLARLFLAALTAPSNSSARTRLRVVESAA